MQMDFGQNWLFNRPVEVRLGVGAALGLKETLDTLGSRTVIVTDRGLAELDFLKNILVEVKPFGIFTDLHPNPTVANVDALTALLRAERACPMEQPAPSRWSLP